jgi:hypothetical protein
MSRKIILTLATALAAATLVVGTADAKKPNGPNNGPKNGPHWNHHHHMVRLHGLYVRPVSYAVPVRVATPGPCTCLTKGYTPEGTVVFKDQCTKEMASAPVDGSSAQASVKDPANFAGQTYEDYQKATSQN